MVSLSYRYLPVFPQEQELNPIEALPAVDAADDAQGPQTDETQAAQAESDAGEPEPAQA
jgi:hypothetical protein